MKITIVIHCLSAGGAQRVVSNMANYWASRRWSVTILTFVDKTFTPFFKLDQDIYLIQLDMAKISKSKMIGVWNNIERIRKLRQAIIQSKADVVISFQENTNVITILATRGLKVPVIISERNEPGYYHGQLWEMIRKITNPLAQKVVIQTDRARVNVLSNLPDSIVTIPNPVVLPELESPDFKDSLDISKPCVIAMGRLEKQKGFDLLIRAFSLLKDDYPEWTLTILGEGSLRADLESLSHELGIKNRVKLPGRIKNPIEWLKKGDIFVMSSRFEGFPNALCEAMACGLPVISTDCRCGPREIIRDGIDGILVENENIESLASAIKFLISNEKIRQSLAERAPEIIERFSLNKVMGMWETVIEEVISAKKN